MAIVLSLPKQVFLFTCILFSSTVFSQIRAVNKSSNWETWYDKVPVSGEIRVGVMAEFNNSNIRLGSFYSLIPEEKKKMLCVEISSRDGRYKANLEYDISNESSGIHEFDWPTIHDSNLTSFKVQDISILAHSSNDCSEDPSFFTLSSWHNNINTNNKIVVLLNTEKHPDIKIDGKTESKCKKLDLPNLTTYNCQCIIDRSLIKKDSEVLIFQRVRKLNRIKYNKYPLPIKL